jgi:hypothetical protein
VSRNLNLEDEWLRDTRLAFLEDFLEEAVVIVVVEGEGAATAPALPFV